MSKDTTNLGHDKALAWESRGFVSLKKLKGGVPVTFDTTP